MSAEYLTDAKRLKIETALSFLERDHPELVRQARRLATYEMGGANGRGALGLNFELCRAIAKAIRVTTVSTIKEPAREIFEQARQLWEQLPLEKLEEITLKDITREEGLPVTA